MTDILWENMSAGEKENLRKQVCQTLMENAEMAEHFEMVKEKRREGYSEMSVQYTLESVSDDSTVTIAVHQDGKSWSPKAGVYVKRDDGYGGERSKSVRYKLASDGSFNADKAADKALEMNHDSIQHTEGRRADAARAEHPARLKQIVVQELTSLLVDEPWEVEANYDGVRLSYEGAGYSGPQLRVDVHSGRPKTALKWEYALTSDAGANIKLMKAVADLTQVLCSVLVSSEFEFAQKELPAFA